MTSPRSTCTSAEGIEQVCRTLERLKLEGLDRHEALHAIGSVLATHMHALLSHTEIGPEPMDEYLRKVGGLTAKGWLASADG